MGDRKPSEVYKEINKQMQKKRVGDNASERREGISTRHEGIPAEGERERQRRRVTDGEYDSERYLGGETKKDKEG